MNFNKLFALFLVVGLLFPTLNLAQTIAPEVKPDALTPELNQTALDFLSLVADETGQFSLPENRVRAQIIVADLMWQPDEKTARAIFQNAFGELQSLLFSVNLPEGVEMTRIEKNKHYAKRYDLADLRKVFVLTLAARDSEAALNALAALKVRILEEYDPLAENDLELQITTTIVKKSPDKSYTVAKQQLDATGVTYEFVEALKSLHKKDSPLAANLSRDILLKIQNVKIRVPSATATTNAAPVNQKTEIDFSQVSSFLTAASEMNRIAERDKAKKMTPALSAAEMKELVELLANAFLTTANPAQYSISQAMPEIKRYSPAFAQRIRQKIGAEASRAMDKVIESNSYYTASREKSAEDLAKMADVSAPEVRDQRYSEAAFKALAENEPEKAQTIAARIKEQKNYTFLYEQIQIALPLAKARRGDLAEVRKMLNTFKTNEERVATLTELASALVAKGDNETAKALLDESLQMMPALVRKQSDLEAAAKIATVYSSAAPEQSFSIVETNIVQMNQYINAGIRLDEFYGGGGADEVDELPFNAINRQILMNIPKATDLMKNLARADFGRAVGLADKFERREIRLFLRLRILQALLDPKAADKEEKDREMLTGDDET